MLTFEVSPGSARINSIVVLQETDDVILFLIDFKERNVSYSGCAFSSPYTEATFYFAKERENGEDEVDDSAIKVTGFPESWQDKKIHSLYEWGRYTAHISLVRTVESSIPCEITGL